MQIDAVAIHVFTSYTGHAPNKTRRYDYLGGKVRPPMYEAYFNLRERPFSTSPDPRFMFLTSQHQEALAKCQAVIERRMGASAIYGDIGAGKTTLARRLVDIYTLPPEDGAPGARCNLAYLFNPNYPSPFQFVRQILLEFGVTQPKRSLLDELNTLQAFLQAEHLKGQVNVLIIDEAHLLSRPILEVIRELLNFETTDAKYLQVALFGETELASQLDRFAALKDRMSLFGQLSALRQHDVADLIAYRWRVAGGTEHPFTPDALARIYIYSGGLPRKICKLCDTALIGAYASGTRVVDPGLIEKAASDLRLPRYFPAQTPEHAGKEANGDKPARAKAAR